MKTNEQVAMILRRSGVFSLEEPLQIVPIYHKIGFQSSFFAVSASGSRHAGTYGIKVYRQDESSTDARLHFDAARLQAEFETIRRLHEIFRGEKVVMSIEPVACMPDEMVIVTAFALGEIMGSMIRRRCGFFSRSKTACLSDLYQYVSLAGRWLAMVRQATEGENTGRLDYRDILKHIDIRLELLARLWPAIFTADVVRDHARSAWSIARSIDKSAFSTTLIHGDFGPNNIICRNGTITVIDPVSRTYGGVSSNRGCQAEDIAIFLYQLDGFFPHRLPAALKDTLVKEFAAGCGIGDISHPLIKLFLMKKNLEILHQLSSMSVREKWMWSKSRFFISTMAHIRLYLKWYGEEFAAVNSKVRSPGALERTAKSE